jgi:hypothetical protein
MNISKAIRAILLADSSVAALIGVNIFPRVVPDDASVPAIAYFRESHERVRSLSGERSTADANYDVECWGTTYDEAEALGDAAHAALADYAGTISGVTFQHIRIIDEDDAFYVSPSDITLQRYGRILTISVVTQ